MAGEFLWGPQNPHPLSKMRTELVWDGKYDEYGNRREVDVASCALPMQRIETVDEPRQRAEAQGQLELFEKNLSGRKQDDFRNRLIWGDNKLVMASLLAEFKGKIDLIYIDPPFDVGADFTMDIPIGDSKETIEKDQSTLEMVAYRDTWGKGTDSYLHMMYERLTLMKELLSERGSIYVHCDSRVNYMLRAIMDDIFGKEVFINEIIWKRTAARSGGVYWGSIHDTLLFYGKGNSPDWTPVFQDYDAAYLEDKYKYSDERGTYRLDNLTAPGTTRGESGKRWRTYDPSDLGRHWAIPVEALDTALSGKSSEDMTNTTKLELLLKHGFIQLPAKSEGKGFPQFKRYLGKGVPIQDVITDLPPVNSQAVERLGYDTQKPESLVERIIRASTADPKGGGGRPLLLPTSSAAAARPGPSRSGWGGGGSWRTWGGSPFILAASA